MQKTKTVYLYTDSKGKCPIKLWLDRLDNITKARIRNRITRLEYGAYGDFKPIKEKIFELRFFFGKGYRIYFYEEDNKIILLLNGGHKDSQGKDIKIARSLLTEYLNNKTRLK
jgi:putative addiction module killer protein